MAQKKVSLKDVARAAKVSTALVSYVLNGKEKENRVGHEIADKIRQIAKELNYEPNYLAKSLRSGKTYTIGLIIADISNPFFANIARLVEDEAKNSGYTVIIGSSDENADKSWNLLTVFINRQVDGFIIVSSENTENQIRYLKDKNIPFILIDRHFPEIQTDFVTINNYKASHDAGTHLIAGGYDRVGMLAYKSQLFHMKERIAGYIDSFKDSNTEFDKNWLKEIDFNTIDFETRKAIDELLSSEQPVNAVIFGTYSLAITGLKYINELQLKVPDDLAIVSFGQAEVFDLYRCPISYIKQPIEDLSKTAVKILLQKFNNQEEETRQILMDSKLILRESSKSKVPD